MTRVVCSDIDRDHVCPKDFSLLQKSDESLLPSVPPFSDLSAKIFWAHPLLPSLFFALLKIMNFYPPPPVLKAELYLRIPDAIRCIGEDTEWRGGFAGPFKHIFLEGPVADSAGNLFVVDVPYGRILKIDVNKNVTVAAKWDGEPNGLAATAKGDLLIADYKQVRSKVKGTTFFQSK
jgi:hypothetical protein